VSVKKKEKERKGKERQRSFLFLLSQCEARIRAQRLNALFTDHIFSIAVDSLGYAGCGEHSR
jgi:hypothetical protein